MPNPTPGAKQGSAKGSPRIISHLKSMITKDGDKDVTLKFTVKGKIFSHEQLTNCSTRSLVLID